MRPLLDEEYTGATNDSKSFAGNAIRHINFTGDKSLDIVRAAGKYLRFLGANLHGIWF